MNIFISGKPGCGKSKLIQELIKELQKKYRIAGIITPELREKHKKTREGFLIIDIASRKKAVMASVELKPAVVSKYGVDVKALDSIAAETEKSLDSADVIIIDEIGKMELCSERFRQLLDKALGSGKLLLATVHHSYAEEYRKKGYLFWLEKDKLAKLKDQITGMLQKQLKQK
jgi:nucleoside-triphosphatase